MLPSKAVKTHLGARLQTPNTHGVLLNYKRILLLVGLVLVVIVVLVGAYIQFLVSPTLREELVKAIEANFDGTAELTDLQISLFPGLSVSGKNLVIRQHGAPSELPPLISIGDFRAKASFVGLFRSPRRIERVSLEQLRINIPPKREKEARREDEDREIPEFVIGTVEADGTVLQMLPKKRGKKPLVFELHQLQIKDAGTGQPMRYDALLKNAKPPGLIDTEGVFGPWDVEDPGNTPVSGKYTFKDADLSVFKGISGQLYSEGKFGGVLRRLEAEGTTDTPAFSVTRAGQRVHLKTTYRAIIDGTNGDTLLQPVKASFGDSEVTCQGGVYEKEGTNGKSVVLDTRMTRGRLEDVMKLAVSGAPPLVGSVSFRAKMEIPPGEQDIVEKLSLDGVFELAKAEFTDPEVQNKIEDLSQSSRGKHDEPNDERIMSNLAGSFRLANGTASFSKLSFNVPGAQVKLAGHYGLVNEELDFKGRLLMQEKLSGTQTGVKSVFLRLVDPFFKGKNTGTDLPIKITGTRAEPKFGLDW